MLLNKYLPATNFGFGILILSASILVYCLFFPLFLITYNSALLRFVSKNEFFSTYFSCSNNRIIIIVIVKSKIVESLLKIKTD